MSRSKSCFPIFPLLHSHSVFYCLIKSLLCSCILLVVEFLSLAWKPSYGLLWIEALAHARFLPASVDGAQVCLQCLRLSRPNQHVMIPLQVISEALPRRRDCYCPFCKSLSFIFRWNKLGNSGEESPLSVFLIEGHFRLDFLIHRSVSRSPSESRQKTVKRCRC